MTRLSTTGTLTAALLLWCGTTLFAQTVIPEKAGKGISFVAADSSFSVKLNGRIQNLYSGELNLTDNGYQDRFVIRRARLKMEGLAFGPKLEYKIELGLSNQDIAGGTEAHSSTANIVLDAIAKWHFAPGFSLWFGQTKLPGNRERLISSQKLQFVDRSMLNSRYNLDRDLGVQLNHESAAGKAVFRQIISVSMGQGRNITADNEGGYDYTGRLEFLPFGTFRSDGDFVGGDLSREESPRLSLAVAYDYNDGATRSGGQLGDFLDEPRDLKTFFADAMFKYRGLSAMAEYADKRTSGTPVVSTGPDDSVDAAFFTGTGFNVQAGYLFTGNFEVAGRYTVVSPERITQRDRTRQYTLGVSRYLAGHTVKLQSDISLLKEAADLSELMYRFQLEIGF
ncbi:MAG TPA: porin [Sphingobacteriaceae bacterium]